MAGGLGEGIVRRINELAAISETPEHLARIFLTPEHRAAADLLLGWMRDAGMRAHLDAIHRAIGRTHEVLLCDRRRQFMKPQHRRQRWKVTLKLRQHSLFDPGLERQVLFRSFTDGKVQPGDEGSCVTQGHDFGGVLALVGRILQ